MHDLLRPLDDLKEIKKSLGKNVDNKTMKLIDTKIAEYESDIKAVDAYLRNESMKYDTSFLDEVNTAHTVEMLNVTGATVYDPNGLPKDFTSKYTEEDK